MAAQDPFASITDKYEVHPECYEFVKRCISLGLKPIHTLPVETTRQMRSQAELKLTGVLDFDGSESEIVIPSPYSAEGIPVSVYKPNSCPEKPAILIYYHGGGLVLGSRKGYETMAKMIARDSGVIIVSVEYRLLPLETARLAPFDDALVAAKWVLENRATLGGHPQSKVGVGGDSSGGHLTISVTNELPGQMDFQMLVYPVCDVACGGGSVQEFVETPGLPATAIHFLFDKSLNYIPDALTNPRINPAVRTNVKTSPPALILLAELDALRDMGLAYAETLRANGVPVQCHVIKGVIHAFFSFPGVFKTKCLEAYEPVVKFLRQFHQ